MLGGFLHIYLNTSSCPYKDNCVQMELGLLTCEMWQERPGYFPFKMIDFAQLFSAFCRCCHHWVPVADKYNFSIDGWGEGETTKEKPISEHHSRTGGEQTASCKSSPVIKDVLLSDLSEEQSCSKPCFDSLFCAEELRTQGVHGEEITSLVALKNCCGLCPQELQQLHLMDRLCAEGFFLSVH